MSEMNVNGIVLDDIVTKQLSQLQDEYARVLSDGLSDIMDFILEDCVPIRLIEKRSCWSI